MDLAARQLRGFMRAEARRALELEGNEQKCWMCLIVCMLLINPDMQWNTFKKVMA